MNCFVIKKFQPKYTKKKTTKRPINPPSLTDPWAPPGSGSEREKKGGRPSPARSGLPRPRPPAVRRAHARRLGPAGRQDRAAARAQGGPHARGPAGARAGAAQGGGQRWRLGGGAWPGRRRLAAAGLLRPRWSRVVAGPGGATLRKAKRAQVARAAAQEAAQWRSAMASGGGWRGHGGAATFQRRRPRNPKGKRSGRRRRWQGTSPCTRIERRRAGRGSSTRGAELRRR